MRAALAVLVSLAGACAQAEDGFLGTKASPPVGPIQGDSAGVGFMSFLQMMVALLIVLALLKFVMPKLVTKLNKRIVTKAGSSIQIEETAAFAGGSLYIVKAKSKTLLLSATSQGVACLADLSVSEPAPEAPTFGEIVDREMAGPMQPLAVVDAGPHSQGDDAMEVAAALERLKRLAG